MALTIPKKSAGMKPWALVRTKIKATNTQDATQSKTFKVKWGLIPQQITPASRFRVLAQSDNCAIVTPWGGTARPDPLVSAGIGGFGLLGAGLSISLQYEFNNLPQTIQYGLGGLKQEFPPTFGYCIDDMYSERTYISFSGINNDFTGEAIITSQNIDVQQKYIFVRFYLHHGEISGYTKNSSEINENEELISFGINKKLDDEFLNQSFDITIYKKDGRIIKKQIKRFLSNFNAVVDKFDGAAPEPGDFYEFDNKITIEDPYLMAGIYLGRENHYKKENISDFNFPETNNQKSYQYTRFSGGYYLKNEQTQEILQNSAGASFNDEENNKWHWVKFDDVKSSVYLDEPERFSQKRVENIYGTQASQESPDKSTSEANETPSSDTIVHAYDYFWRLKGNEDELKTRTDFMRLEIAHAGDTARNNFHYPMLKNSYVKQNNKYFKILAQLDSVTIDVALKSVDGTSDLDIHADIEIIQQYGWKINEHYSNVLYLFGDGKIQSITDKEIILSCDASHLSSGTVADLNGKLSGKIPYMEANSFFYRFLNKLDEQNTFYQKGNNWKLYVNNTNLAIKKLIYGKRISDTKYEIALELQEQSQNLFKVNDLCE